MIGFFLSTLLNLFIKRLWACLPIATAVCFFIAYLDEYSQQFVAGRGSQWLDVRIDTFGAFTGIILSSVIFFIVNRVQRLKMEIKRLKPQQDGGV